MTRSQLRIGIIGAVLLLLITTGVIWQITRSNRYLHQLPSQQATEAQKEEFLTLYQQYQWIFSTARSTGDVSAFPTLFYNDPAFDISGRAPDCKPLIERYSDQVASVLVAHGAESQMSTPGLLSCEIADIFYLYESASKWEAVRTEAASEGNTPSISDLPDELQPMDLPSHTGQGNAIDVAIQSATTQGNRATVTFIVPAYGSLHEHMLLTERNGSWYISGLWTSGNS